MTGVIDVGGGLRGIYGCGIFDRLMDDGISFDYCIGVSAGAANLTSYLSGQRGRNYRFYMEYAFRKQYMSAGIFCARARTSTWTMCTACSRARMGKILSISGR
jgi:predicted patatin/cPLA2 family phospholipase